jgi:hypothetical protein
VVAESCRSRVNDHRVGARLARLGLVEGEGRTVEDMATHEIDMTVPAQMVKNKDVEVRVRSDGAAYGTVQISKGSIDWVPANNKVHRYGMTWEKFDELMREHGRRKNLR